MKKKSSGAVNAPDWEDINMQQCTIDTIRVTSKYNAR